MIGDIALPLIQRLFLTTLVQLSSTQCYKTFYDVIYEIL